MLALLLLVGVASCSEDNNDNNPDSTSYNTKVYITDGPIDNADVQAVFVTVADVKVDGQSIEGFTKTTVELTALQNGSTQLLGNIDMEAGTFNNLTLVLDSESDASGNTPANYVLTQSNEKIELTSDSNTLTLNNSYSIEASEDNELVIDFDLRKAIVTDSGNTTYSFSSQSQLENSLRVVNSLNAGTIMGTATNNTGFPNNVTIAYAYNAGSFTTGEQNENSAGVQFENAVTSSVASGSTNQFQLNFLEEGNYEIHFASYEDSNNDGKLEFAGMIDVETATTIDLMAVDVTANSEVTLEVLLQGILPLL